MANTNDSKELAKETISAALADIPVYEPPALLYRFSGPSALSSFTEGKLKLTPPAQFNDPFEVFAGISEGGLTEESVLRSILYKTSLFRLSVEANRPKDGLNTDDYEKRLIEAVRAEPKIWRQHLKSSIEAVASTCADYIGIACFSAFTSKHMLGEIGIHHWAMYGGQHRGFAIGYNGEHPFFRSWAAEKWFFPVEYREKRGTVDLSYFDNWDDRKMWRTFRDWSAIKSQKAWAHEREWRLMCPVDTKMPPGVMTTENDLNGVTHYFLNLWGGSDSPDERAYRSSIISSVTIGARASDDLIEKVLSAVTLPYLRHVAVWKVEASDEEYALVPKRLA